MFIGNPPGNHDRILDFSTAVTGGLFFVPSADFLDDPPTPDRRDAAERRGVCGSGRLTPDREPEAGRLVGASERFR